MENSQKNRGKIAQLLCKIRGKIIVKSPKNRRNMKNHAKILGKSRKSHGKVMEKSWKIHAKSLKNHGKIMENSRKNH